MDWVKRKGTTGKVEPSEKFLEEEKFTFQRAISQIVLEHAIPLDLALNLDQTPLSYVSPGASTHFLQRDPQMFLLRALTTRDKLLLLLLFQRQAPSYLCSLYTKGNLNGPFLNLFFHRVFTLPLRQTIGQI